MAKSAFRTGGLEGSRKEKLAIMKYRIGMKIVSVLLKIRLKRLGLRVFKKLESL
jgi:hypothetical protein